MTDQVDLSDESLIAADFNGDDNINVLDGDAYEAADVNFDGLVNVLDIVEVMQYILTTP